MALEPFEALAGPPCPPLALAAAPAQEVLPAAVLWVPAPVPDSCLSPSPRIIERGEEIARMRSQNKTWSRFYPLYFLSKMALANFKSKCFYFIYSICDVIWTKM